jgi:hypothetical protein
MRARRPHCGHPLHAIVGFRPSILPVRQRCERADPGPAGARRPAGLRPTVPRATWPGRPDRTRARKACNGLAERAVAIRLAELRARRRRTAAEHANDQAGHLPTARWAGTPRTAWLTGRVAARSSALMVDCSAADSTQARRASCRRWLPHDGPERQGCRPSPAAWQRAVHHRPCGPAYADGWFEAPRKLPLGLAMGQPYPKSNVGITGGGGQCPESTVTCTPPSSSCSGLG